MIRLDNIVLRNLEPDDVVQLYRFRNDPEIANQLGGFSSGYARQDLVEWIERHRNAKSEVLWAIANAADNKCIGHVGLYDIDNRIGKAEFGIVIGDRDFQGKGVGSTVTSAVITYGFQELRLHKIALTVLSTNARAIHLYSRLGFSQDGTLRDDQFRSGVYVDSILMSILEHEWEARSTTD